MGTLHNLRNLNAMKLTTPLYVIFLIFLICKNVYGQKIEKLYYNQTWKSCKKKEASFYRLVTFDDNGKSIGLVKDYYIVSRKKYQLLFESEAIFIGKDDDSKTIWKGKSISYFLSGKKSAEIMRDDTGDLNGLSVRYFENSNKKEEINFKENRKNGEAVFYYENGQVKEKGNFLNNKRCGIFTCYNENGKIKHENKFLLDGEYEDEYGEKYILTNIDFQDNKNFSDSGDNNTTLMENGELFIDFNKRFEFCKKTFDTTLSDNFSIELKIRLDSILTSSNIKQGIVFNYESWENYSWFGADKYGEIFITTVRNGSTNVIWTNSNVPGRPSALNCPKPLSIKRNFYDRPDADADTQKPIRFGEYENSFRIDCHNDEYYFYINSEYVFQTNKVFFKPLSFGLLVGDYFDSKDQYSLTKLGHNNNKYNNEAVGNISMVNIEIKRYIFNQTKSKCEKLNEFTKLENDSSLIIYEYKDNCYVKISEPGDIRKFIEIAAHQKYDSLISERRIDRLKVEKETRRDNRNSTFKDPTLTFLENGLLDHDSKTFQTIKSSLISNSIAPMVYAYIGPKSKYSSLGSKISSEDFKLLRSKKRFSFIYDYMPFYQTFDIQNKDYDKNEFIIGIPGATFTATDKISIKQNKTSYDLNGKIDDNLFIFTLKSDYYSKIIPYDYAAYFKKEFVPTIFIKTAMSQPLLISNLLVGCDSFARADFYNAPINLSFNNLHLIPSISKKLDAVFPRFMGYNFLTRDRFVIKMKEFIINNENQFVSNYKSNNRVTKNILKGLYICFGKDENINKMLLDDNDINNYDCQILNSLLSYSVTHKDGHVGPSYGSYKRYNDYAQNYKNCLRIYFVSNKIVYAPDIQYLDCHKFSPYKMENELNFINKALSLNQKNPLGYIFKAMYSSNETINKQNGDYGSTICSQCDILKTAYLYRSELDSDYANEFSEMYDDNCVNCSLCNFNIVGGKSIKTGARGGKYTINSNGNKTYVKD
jgi:antitoxin component YwqK of YwqJK toxin-antitoxin module